MFTEKIKTIALPDRKNPTEKPCEKETKELYEICFSKWKNCDALFETYQTCMRKHYKLPR